MEWRQSQHPEFEVSEFGDMRAITERYSRPIGTVVKGHKQKEGYTMYNLVHPDEHGRGAKKMHCSAHRMVLFAFIGPPPTDDHQAAHWDGNPANNHYSNLRWATAAENTADKMRHGTHRQGNRRFTEDDVIDIRARNKSGQSYNIICALYKTSKSNISSIINRKTWGYIDDAEAIDARIRELKDAD